MFNVFRCENINDLDQVSKETTTYFRWNDHSKLYGDDKPKLSAGFIEVDR